MRAGSLALLRLVASCNLCALMLMKPASSPVTTSVSRARRCRGRYITTECEIPTRPSHHRGLEWFHDRSAVRAASKQG